MFGKNESEYDKIIVIYILFSNCWFCGLLNTSLVHLHK